MLRKEAMSSGANRTDGTMSEQRNRWRRGAPK